MNDILDDVHEERNRQDRRWGIQNHDLPVWLTILAEEVGELAQATLDAEFGPDYLGGLGQAREEAIQVAAVAVAIAERIDRMTSAREAAEK